MKNRDLPTRPLLSSGDLRFCCRKMSSARRFSILPALPENELKPSVRKRKIRQTSENSPLNVKTAFRRFYGPSRTYRRKASSRVALRKSQTAVNHFSGVRTKVELHRKADLWQIKRPPYSTSSNIFNDALCIGIQILHTKAKCLSIKSLIAQIGWSTIDAGHR